MVWLGKVGIWREAGGIGETAGIRVGVDPQVGIRLGMG